MNRLAVACLVGTLAVVANPGRAQNSPEASLLELSAQEHVLLDELAVIETRLLVLHTELEALHIQERHLESHLLELDGELGRAEGNLEQKRSAVGRRARALYMGSERGFLQLLFSATDLGELLQGSRYLTHVLARDEQLLSELHLQHDDHDSLRQIRQEEFDRLKTRIDERQVTQAEQRDLRERRAQLLSGVRSDRRAVALAAAGSHHAEDVVLEVTSETTPLAIQDDLVGDEDEATLNLADTPSLGFAYQKGRLILPSVGDIVGSFGWYDVEGADDRVFRGGIDIDAASGDEVRAVYAGQVRRAEQIRGFGNAVILDHGEDYFTVYAHMAALDTTVGEMVTAGQPIGTVADSGSTRSALLHFEIRHRSEAVDPLDWVKLPPGIEVKD